jgi:hypothetical protein
VAVAGTLSAYACFAASKRKGQPRCFLCLESSDAVARKKRRSRLVSLDNASVRRASDVKYLGLLLDPKLLCTKHLRTVSNKAIGTPCNIFPLLNRDSTLSQTSKLTLYKLLIPSLLTYAAPVCNTTCNSNYLKLQIVQNKSLSIIGDYPRGTPIFHLHDSLLNLFETSFTIWRWY